MRSISQWNSRDGLDRTPYKLFEVASDTNRSVPLSLKAGRVVQLHEATKRDSTIIRRINHDSIADVDRSSGCIERRSIFHRRDHRIGFFESTKQDRGLYKVDVVMESDRQAIMCRPDKVFFALNMFPNGVILFVCMWAQLTGKPINYEDTPC